jgi:hypothetical protein
LDDRRAGARCYDNSSDGEDRYDGEQGAFHVSTVS